MVVVVPAGSLAIAVHNLQHSGVGRVQLQFQFVLMPVILRGKHRDRGTIPVQRL